MPSVDGDPGEGQVMIAKSDEFLMELQRLCTQFNADIVGSVEVGNETIVLTTQYVHGQLRLVSTPLKRSK